MSSPRQTTPKARVPTPKRKRHETSELLVALKRADKLILWMSYYIGNMAPGDYATCYADLNEHGIFMDRLDREFHQ